jgi:hypothetical protein
MEQTEALKTLVTIAQLLGRKFRMVIRSILLAVKIGGSLFERFGEKGGNEAEPLANLHCNIPIDSSSEADDGIIEDELSDAEKREFYPWIDWAMVDQ